MSKVEMPGPLSSSFLRTQAERCLRLSRMCMDMGTARDLRLMSEEYFADAKKLEEIARSEQRSDIADNSNQMRDQRSARG
jgi:hypothetical protein